MASPVWTLVFFLYLRVFLVCWGADSWGADSWGAHRVHGSWDQREHRLGQRAPESSDSPHREWPVLTRVGISFRPQ